MKLGTLSNEAWLSRSMILSMIATAVFIRAVVFGLYIQPSLFYNQPDTPDYHGCAISLATGNGMTNLRTGEPIFWRTPGYSAFLAPFYYFFGFGWSLNDTKKAHAWALWIQILICSLLPLLFAYLVFALTKSKTVALSVGWISVFHLGYILASGYLLSDALSLLPFGLYLLFLLPHVPGWSPSENQKLSWHITIAAAVCLALYTWIRPNGQFACILTIVFLLLSGLPWRIKLQRIVLFITIFGALIAPWYMRNYSLTRNWFYCPMSGPYLQTFNAPKILRRLTHKPLVECIQALLQPVFQTWLIEQEKARQEIPLRYVSRELICAQSAWPLIMKYPWWFLCDWMREVTKTTFDLYAYQLVAMAKKIYFFDPEEEFLSIKLKECLYMTSIPSWIRLLAWLEALFMIFTWLGLVGSFIIFVVPLMRGTLQDPELCHYAWLWLKTAFITGGMLWMTGGFGYARLRLPIEPLLMIMAGLFWYWIYRYICLYRSYYSARREDRLRQVA